MITDERSEKEFTLFYNAHYAAVLAYCLRRVGHMDAHDAVAEVFTVAWRKLDEAPSADRHRSWLYGIAYRVLSHHWRSQKRYRRLRDRLAGLTRGVESGPESVVMQRDHSRQVVEAAHRLGPMDQEILRLAGWEEISHAEIATLLGISIAAVDQRFHRAKKRLAREYNRLESQRAGTTRPEGGSG